MPDFNVRSDSVNVEQIMEQIRARIRESRGVDYSEQQVRELAAAKLDKLLEQFRRVKPPEQPPNYTFGGDTLFESPVGLLRVVRRLLRPILRLFFNPNVLADALHTQAELNARQARLEASRHMLYDELIHNLVIEAARLGLEVKSLKMRVESVASRLEFSERRARTLESTIAYKPSAEDRAVPAPSIPPPPPPSSPPPSPPLSASASSPPLAPASAPPTVSGHRPMGPGPSGAPDGQRRRRRRRRGRRGGGSRAVNFGAPPGEGNRGGPGGPGGAASGAPQPSPASADADAAPLEGDEAHADVFTEDAGPEDSGPDEPGDPGDNNR
ncbi:MAG: hypothetical protein A3G76_11265 [Acidobacteria bacterium RIFCSPLOWO2_12_FULL_65_11]|nr:MAG: hypothetical protein A3H95_00370 [Acidobacteria bacterium RIFCSPLOWO2_02_FULL_64_15]OFW31904.1 MAG: hypothetical protein A3G76_11265 [Acidobacteria bacterium RIFCSPLOWO2_12_FULL_65_11]